MEMNNERCAFHFSIELLEFPKFFTYFCILYGQFQADLMLEDIRKNIERLIALYEGERQRNRKLLSDLGDRDAEIASCRKQIADLERQVDNLKLTEAFTAPAGSNPAAKEKINKMITGIDRCIALLEE